MNGSEGMLIAFKTHTTLSNLIWKIHELQTAVNRNIWATGIYFFLHNKGPNLGYWHSSKLEAQRSQLRSFGNQMLRLSSSTPLCGDLSEPNCLVFVLPFLPLSVSPNLINSMCFTCVSSTVFKPTSPSHLCLTVPERIKLIPFVLSCLLFSLQARFYLLVPILSACLDFLLGWTFVHKLWNYLRFVTTFSLAQEKINKRSISIISLTFWGCGLCEKIYFQLGRY